MTRSSPDYKKRFVSIKGARLARTLLPARVAPAPAHHAIGVTRPAREVDSQGGAEPGRGLRS
jgi:hypothetical protein